MNAPFGILHATLRNVPAAVSLAVPLFLASMHGGALAQGMRWSAESAVNQACVKCNATYGDLKVHSSGNALAIWVQNDGVPDIAVARFDATSGQWRGFRTLQAGTFTGNARGVHRPQLAMDGRGNAVAVWVENASHTIYYALYRASDMQWSAPAVAHVAAGFSFTDMAIGMDAQNNAFLHWRENGGRQLMARRYDARTGTWSASLPVAFGDSIQQSQLAVDPLGNAMILWLRNSDYTIQYVRYSQATGQWSTPRQAGKAAQGSGVRLVLDRNGNGMGMWNTGGDANDPDGRLSAIRYIAGNNSWSGPRALQAAGSVLKSPDLTADSSGNIVFAWGEAADYTQPMKITVARYAAATGQWSAPKKVSFGTQNDIFSRIASDSRGNAVVVWSRLSRFAENGDRFFRKASVGFHAATGQWSSVSVHPAEVLEAFPYAVSFDVAGNATALYHQDSGYRWNGSIIYGLRANRLTPVE